MADSELVDYIREQTQQGVTAENLRVSLMEAGWHESDINNALHDVAAGLHPATPGASIHEDLAQVRGMVAHLATRVHSIEATLASTGALGMQEQLPSGTLGPDHEISAPKRHHWFGRTLSLLALIALFGFVGSYASGLVAHNALAPLDQLIIAAAAGALLLVCAIIAMRRHSAWTASLLTASALMLWGMDGLISWRAYHYMEWTTAVALGVLLVVIAVVMGSWIRRYSSR
ncbi:MAG: hypothetical protein AAB375_00970 [Patescibacteria group bacterium]